MSVHFNCAYDCASHRYVHSIPYRDIRIKSDELKGLHARHFDVAGLDYESLAHQVLVRDLRREADDLGIQDSAVMGWSYNPIQGALEVAFQFSSDAYAVTFKLRVA
jgi:hypothetical protein